MEGGNFYLWSARTENIFGELLYRLYLYLNQRACLQEMAQQINTKHLIALTIDRSLPCVPNLHHKQIVLASACIVNLHLFLEGEQAKKCFVIII